MLGVGLPGQVLSSVVVFVALVLSTRRFAAKWTGKDDQVRTAVDALVGKTAVVTKEIQGNERGLVKVGGEEWSAKSEDGRTIPQGVQVEILRVDGVHLVVKAPE